MATQAHTVPRFHLNHFVSPECEGPDPFVWVGDIASGAVKRRAPKNLSIVAGFYDGPGGFKDGNASLEAHLAKIEGSAASAIRHLVASPPGSGALIGPEIWRLIAWQAARTPGMAALFQRWGAELDDDSPDHLMEPQPEGFEQIEDRLRNIVLKHPATGEFRTVRTVEDFDHLRRQGWEWMMQPEDRLELMHMQAWYFQVRHFPRLSWLRLDAPPGESFIIGDRGVSWLAGGCRHAAFCAQASLSAGGCPFVANGGVGGTT